MFRPVTMESLVFFVGGLGDGWLNVAFLSAVWNRSQDSERGTNLAVARVFFLFTMMLTPLVPGWLLAGTGQVVLLCRSNERRRRGGPNGVGLMVVARRRDDASR